MAEIVNLNRFRKAKAKADALAAAAENRVRFGRSKAERGEASSHDALAQKRIEGHRLQPTVTVKDDEPPASA